MLLLAVILVFLSVTLLVCGFVVRIALAPRRTAMDRLNDVRPTTYQETVAVAAPRPTASQRSWWRGLMPQAKQDRLAELKVIGLSTDSPISRTLLHAGFRSKKALSTFHIARMVCVIALGSLSGLVSSRYGLSSELTFLLIAIGGLMGHMLPKTYIRLRASHRQHRLRLSLPDALDLLVVCVEAGMGLNQAIVRVSEELQSTHREISDEFRLVNLEIAAGRTRPEALRSLGERTGVDDIISLAAMIIQTDKFGTSIARSLRVHSDCLRVERRQRAEEAAAKTTIKLIFPLLFCIFPALFVVVLGPAALHLWEIFGKNFS
jgi:tight adherence protein C